MREAALPGIGFAARVSNCDEAGASPGVGSNVTQPIPSNHTSIHEWASRSRTTYSCVLLSSVPGAKPATTRDGIPSIRSISAAAPENCWQ